MKLRAIPRRTAPALDTVRGSLVALATPFRGGRIDEARLFALTENQVRAGSAGLVACGSTGEAAALSPAEHARVLTVVLEAALGRVPVIAGVGAACTEAAVALAAAAARGRVDAVLVAPPPYTRPTQEGIIAHVRAVATASDLPVILYDVPARTGVAIDDATVARLHETGMIVGIKDATADLARPPRLLALCGAGFLQFTGDDATAIAYRAMGGHGCISVTANLVPALLAALHRAWDAREMQTVADLRDRLAPLHAALFLETNPIPLKAAMDLAGLCDAALRLPLTTASVSTLGRLASLLPPLLEAEEACIRQPRLSLVR